MFTSICKCVSDCVCARNLEKSEHEAVLCSLPYPSLCSLAPFLGRMIWGYLPDVNCLVPNDVIHFRGLGMESGPRSSIVSKEVKVLLMRFPRTASRTYNIGGDLLSFLAINK